MPGQIGQFTKKAVAIARHLAEKRHAAPAKPMPDGKRFRRLGSPKFSCGAEMLLEDAGLIEPIE
jgi:hypothetical protein